MNLNKAQVIGNLTKTPELRTTKTGKNVISFSLAVNKFWKDQNGQKQEAVEFINCVAWSRTAEIIGQYAIKGQNLYVEGSLQTRNYEDKDKVTRYVTEIVVYQMQLGQKPKSAQDNPAPAPVPTTNGKEPSAESNSVGPPAGDMVNVEDIPF